MNGIGLLFVILLAVVWWGYQGYFIYLACSKKKKIIYPSSARERFFSIIVPTFNENELAVKKIESLKNLKYSSYEVLFVDASSDQTPEIIKEHIKDDKRFTLIRSQVKGRSRQINAALKEAKGELIVISDCDGIIASDALEKTAVYFRDELVAVVGSCVFPESDYVYDRIFWQGQNILRFLESDYGHCPAVAGVCYAFRRSLLDSLPDGVWSDDIYVPFLANTKGFACVYARDSLAFELRTPKDLRGFIAHKSRKGQDYLKELLRFVPKIALMHPRWLVVFLTRFIQVAVLPWLLLLTAVLALYQGQNVQLLSILIIAASGLVQWTIFKSRSPKARSVNFIRVLEVFILTNFILIPVLMRYVLNRGKITYEKV